MCGIAGLWNYRSGALADTGIIHAMCNAMEHRGPDGDGIQVLGELGLGHRRLAIIDLTGGAQPMADDRKKIWVTFNGEIYNFKALREEFEKDGIRFKTKSDTEVIPYCYIKYGDNYASKLEGMFAIALWDQNKKRLLLSRDRMGKKPLLYFHGESGVVFGSEVQALERHPEFSKRIDPQGMDAYLTLGYIPHTISIFQNLRKVAPAHTLIIDDSGAEKSKAYWSVPLRQPSRLPLDEAKQQLRSILRDSIEKRLVADVPLGAFLSGGTDSSLVAAIASRDCGQKLQTFCIGFDEQSFDERKDARAVSTILGTDHHEDLVQLNGVEVLPRLQRHFGEPFADASAIPTFYLCRQLRKDVTVAISGDGGDELFLGYNRYRRLAIRHRLHSYLSGLPLADSLADKSRNRLKRRRGKIGRALNLLEDACLKDYEQFLVSSSFFSASERRNMYLPELRRQLGDAVFAADRIEQLFDRFSCREFEEKIGLVDQNLYMVDDILSKVDIASMAASLEVRAPLLDHRVVEFAALLPLSYKMNKNQGKMILKSLLADYIPQQLVDKPKQGFGVPVSQWMKTGMQQMVEELLLAPGGFIARYFAAKPVKSLYDDHMQGRHCNKDALWALVCLGLWADQFGLNTSQQSA